MQAQSLIIKSFRCFDQYTLTFDQPITLIQGGNGTGKTTILEALYFITYMRSFRTHAVNELVRFEHPGLFVKLVTALGDEIVVGIDNQQKIIKVNNAPIKKYKDLINHFTTVSITENDLALITGSPVERRLFLDTLLSVKDTSYFDALRKYRKVLIQRNALLASSRLLDDEMYDLWTAQLSEIGGVIQNKRLLFLEELEIGINQLLSCYFPLIPPLSIRYNMRMREANNDLKSQEMRTRRSLFGPHLDDFSVLFFDHPAKNYASRGQQKLIVILLKVACALLFEKKPLLLLDDFLGDFDEQKIAILVKLIVETGFQTIYTVPLEKNILSEQLSSYPHQKVQL